MLIVLFKVPSVGQMKEDIKLEIDKIIHYDTEINSKNIAGYSIGLMYEDSIFVFHFGSSDFGDSIPLRDTSTFELGGMSKIFTATLIEILVQEEILDYKKPFNAYLDTFYHNKAMANLTIEDLVTHCSRLPKLPYEFGVNQIEANNPYAHYTKEDLLDYYKNYAPDKEVKKEYFYSPINYALLEIAIENSTGMAFEDILKEKLFDPLEMNNTFVHTEKQKNISLTPGFSISGNPAPAFKFQSFAASEGIKSSMKDLIKFVTANMESSSSEWSAMFKNVHKPIKDIKHNKETKIAKGWHVLKPKKYYNVILHSGSTNGHRAFIGFVKETKTGVILLSNSEHREDGLGFLILRMLNYDWKKKKNKR